MLVLSRTINERILIGENIVLEVLGIQGGVVRLGIKAPREVSVVRHELRERLVSDNREWANKSSLPGTACPEAAELCVL